MTRWQLEHRHGADQVLRLGLQAAGGSGHFFHQRGILLRHRVKLSDAFIDLGNAGGLLMGGVGNLLDELAYRLH